MSKQAKAKVAQGYVDKAPPKNCAVCKHYASTTTEETGYHGTWYKESNIRCQLGCFAVKKTAVCNKFEPSK